VIDRSPWEKSKFEDPEKYNENRSVEVARFESISRALRCMNFGSGYWVVFLVEGLPGMEIGNPFSKELVA